MLFTATKDIAYLKQCGFEQIFNSNLKYRNKLKYITTYLLNAWITYKIKQSMALNYSNVGDRVFIV